MVDEWVEVARALGDRELRVMDKLVRIQRAAVVGISDQITGR